MKNEKESTQQYTQDGDLPTASKCIDVCFATKTSSMGLTFLSKFRESFLWQFRNCWTNSKKKGSWVRVEQMTQNEGLKE